MFHFTPTPLDGALIIEPQGFGDERGFFMETYSEKAYKSAGITAHFVQDNHTRSKAGVLR
jgi:dTDP-4-dehydrorhamnose 3,5-epimerase